MGRQFAARRTPALSGVALMAASHLALMLDIPDPVGLVAVVTSSFGPVLTGAAYIANQAVRKQGDPLWVPVAVATAMEVSWFSVTGATVLAGAMVGLVMGISTAWGSAAARRMVDFHERRPPAN